MHAKAVALVRALNDINAVPQAKLVFAYAKYHQTHTALQQAISREDASELLKVSLAADYRAAADALALELAS